jgi:hypothetical protein
MSDIKVFKLQKVTSKDVIFVLHPISNNTLSRTIRLTKRNPFQPLPLDWALGVFSDDGVYRLYEKGYITFDHNEELVKAAYENGVYFDDKLSFEPAKTEDSDEILRILKSGKRADIVSAIQKYGEDRVKAIVSASASELTTNVVIMLEGLLKTQFIVDGIKDDEVVE